MVAEYPCSKFQINLNTEISNAKERARSGEGSDPRVGRVNPGLVFASPLGLETSERAGLFEHFVLLVSAAEDIGEEVEDFFFLEHGEEHGGHRGDLGDLDALDFFAIDVDALIGIGEVGVEGDVVAAEVDDHAGNDFAVILGNDDGGELIADFFAGVDDGIEEIVGAVSSAGAGEVGSVHAAGVAEAVAGEAGGGGEHFAALGEITIGHAFLGGGAEFFEGPHLRGASCEHFAEVFDG